MNGEGGGMKPKNQFKYNKKKKLRENELVGSTHPTKSKSEFSILPKCGIKWLTNDWKE